MTWRGPTYRVVDGERIEGLWRHVWRRGWSGTYYVDDLLVFADGAIGCEELTDIAGLGRLLASGRISATEPGRGDLPVEPSKWRSRRGEPLTPEGFVLEVADRIEALNGRPTTADRCWDAIRRYRDEPTESNRLALRQAYRNVPPHRRIHVLGDMDRQDRPLRILATDIGQPVDGDGPVVTAFMHQQTLDYFIRADGAASTERIRYPDDPVGPSRPALTLHETVHPQGWPETLDLFVLRNEYPSAVVIGNETYPSVTEAYASLTGHEDPSAIRLSLMADLLRAKFAQHAELAEILLSTGDARLSYTGSSVSSFWRDAPDGRNWLGRLLELVRSELVVVRRSPDGGRV
ncbi:NADAR family protein [Streptomyces sp. NPDC051211]|uniref:NADAR family protein n=1 Tax=Streptomyces sp. NPDC051211 TaxID=3154643 RepID=UPI00344C9937